MPARNRCTDDEIVSAPPGIPPAAEARWQALVERYGPFLRNTIARLCPRDLGLDFDDIEQEVRLRLWRAVTAETEFDQAASYLYRAAANAVVDAIRRATARREVHRDPAGPQDDLVARQRDASVNVAAAPPPDRIVGEKLAMERVERVYSQLGDDRRLAVGLHLQGFTTPEVADLTGWRESKARSLIYRGLAELRRRLAEEGIEL